jgi:hypothetical protein
MIIHSRQNDPKYLVKEVIFISNDLLIIVTDSPKEVNIIHEIMQKKILTSPIIDGEKTLNFLIKACDQTTLQFYSKPKNALSFSNNSNQAVKSLRHAGFLSENMYNELIAKVNNPENKLYDESKEEKNNFSPYKS